MQTAQVETKDGFIPAVVVELYDRLGDSQFFSWRWAVIDIAFLSLIFLL